MPSPPRRRAAAIASASLLALASTAVEASPRLPNGDDTVDAIPMSGPFPSLEAYCEGEGIDVAQCLAPPTRCGTSKGVGKLAGAFPEARVLAGCEIALRAPAGWYLLSTTGLPGWAAFLNNGDRYASEITSIAPSADRASVLVRGTFVHGTAASKMPWLDNPPQDDDGWYECEDRLFVCRIGDGGPSCAGPFPVAFTVYCRDRENPARALHRRESHDFRFVPELKGTTLMMRSPSPKQSRKAVLPGWAVIAIDAPNTLGVTRDLSPERVTLRFP
jgi:hypothetical protein